MQQRHLQQLIHRGIYVTTCKIALLLFCIWTSNISLSVYKMLILKSYTVPVRLYDVTNFLNQKTFSSKHVSSFLQRKYDVISRLRHSSAKDHFCVTPLIWWTLSKPPQRRQGPDPRPLWLLIGTSSAFGPELAYRLRVAQPTLMDVTRYFWYTLYY